jgi:hypothetical protein
MVELHEAGSIWHVERHGKEWSFAKDLLSQVRQYVARTNFYENTRTCPVHRLNLVRKLDRTDHVFAQESLNCL